MIGGKVIDYLGSDEQGNRKFIVEFPPEVRTMFNPTEKTIVVAHDYVQISTRSHMYQQNRGDGTFPYKNKTVCNWVDDIPVSVQISIRDMIDIVLPFLNNHQYCQQEHIADRVHTEDDKYYKDYNLTEPRYKAGDKYPAYAYYGSAIKFYDPIEKQHKVAIRRTDQKNYDIISQDLYNSIKDTLELNKNQWQKNKK